MASLTRLGKSLGIILRTCHYLRIGTKKDVGENKKEWVICTRFTIGCDLTLMLFLHRFWLVKNKTLNKKYFISLRMYLDIFPTSVPPSSPLAVVLPSVELDSEDILLPGVSRLIQLLWSSTSAGF